MNQKGYTAELCAIISSLPEEQKQSFISIFSEREKNPVVSFGLNCLLGTFGADLFYLGRPGLAILKLLTVGGAGIWILVNYFTIGGATREWNIQTAKEVRASMTKLAQ